MHIINVLLILAIILLEHQDVILDIILNENLKLLRLQLLLIPDKNCSLLYL